METRITINSMRLVNFKGVRELGIVFGEKSTSIMGRNGSGKTTVFDAFTWLLFGKDSQDRKAFSVKTRDEQGNEIPKLPHEVSASISVNGKHITLTRRLSEKWVKRRGSAVEEFTGNTEERLYNDVPCSVKEWQEKINAICPEQTFKFITNPLYFSLQKPEVQRAMLFRMAGGVSDSDVAQGNADFEALLGRLTGKTMDEYKREIAAKKRRVKAELEGIPERIDERRRDVPEAEDWVALESELKSKQGRLADVELQIADQAKAVAAQNQQRVELMKKVGNLQSELQARKMEITQQVQADYYEQEQHKRQLLALMQDERNSLDFCENRKAAIEKEISDRKAKREEFIKEWKEINARTLTFDDGAFICPTCHRQLEVDDIERKQQEMQEAFNERKAEDKAKNERLGKANSDQIRTLKVALETMERNIDEKKAKITKWNNDPRLHTVTQLPDASPEIASDARCKALASEIEQLTVEAEKTPQTAADDDLSMAKQVLTAAIDELKARLGKRDTIERNDRRIAELEAQMRTQAQELARLEGEEFTMQAFSKAKIEAIEGKINALFKVVKFKMFDRQINGGEVETCKATVNGQPFDDGLNSAGRINAGLDIINAICKSEGVYVPIFVDNSESINQLLPTKSQMVKLIVTAAPRLQIISENNSTNN